MVVAFIRCIVIPMLILTAGFAYKETAGATAQAAVFGQLEQAISQMGVGHGRSNSGRILGFGVVGSIFDQVTPGAKWIKP